MLNENVEDFNTTSSEGYVVYEEEERHHMKWGWSLVLGLILIFLGIGAMTIPITLSAGVNIFFGWILVIAAIIQFIYSFFAIKKGTFLLNFLFSIVSLLFGIFLISNVGAGLLLFTVLLGLFFLIQGIVYMVTAFILRPDFQWGRLLFNGIISILLSLVILTNLITLSLISVGFLIAISLTINGISMVMAGMTVLRPNMRHTKTSITLGIIIAGLAVFLSISYFMSPTIQSSVNVVIENTYGNTVVYGDSSQADMVMDCKQREGTFNQCGPSNCNQDQNGNYTACTRDCRNICTTTEVNPETSANLPAIPVHHSYGNTVVYESGFPNAEYVLDCREREGSFNSCGSNCPPGVVCTAVCAPTCTTK